MSGTKAGSIKSQMTIRAKYGLTEDGKSKLHALIGSIGGKNGVGTEKGFAFPLLCDCDYTMNPHKKAECAGSKGGAISRRKKRLTYTQEDAERKKFMGIW